MEIILKQEKDLNHDKYNSNEYLVKDLDSGNVYDIRNKEDFYRLELDQNIKHRNPDHSTYELDYILENLKIQDKINTKFFKACECGDYNKVLKLLDEKFCHDRRPNINEKYLHDYTVLHIAITNSHTEIITTLIDKGSDIEAETMMKRTPLHLATNKGDFYTVDLLISCGAHVNCKDVDNNTPLHYASRSGMRDIVELLINKRADISIRNIHGETPLDIVCNIEVYYIFLNFLGRDSINNFRSNYSRMIFQGEVYHNNRGDNIRKILYKDRLISQQKSSNSNEIDIPSSSVHLESFKILELLGKGSFGEVYLVEMKSSKKYYAMKVLNKSKIMSQNIIRYVVTERNILSNIKHPFIVQLHYAFQTDEFLYLILEYCKGKDLGFHLRKAKNFDEKTVKIILAQLLLAIEELHRNGIIYRDLKPENIVLDEDGFIKLTDFGLSKEGICDNTSAKSFCGSLAYLAPEILNQQGHGKSVDWYLLGVLMYEMLQGIPPYYTNVSKDALFYNIKHGKLNFNKTISFDAKNLIIKLLNRNPLKRLGSGILDANELKGEPFFSDINFNKIVIKQFIPPRFNYDENESNLIIKSKEIICNRDIVEDMKSNKKNPDTCIEGWTFIAQNKINIKSQSLN